jgi:hypothetical protein
MADDIKTIPQYIEKEFEKNNIEPIQVDTKEFSDTVPSDLAPPYWQNGPFWGLLAIVCSEGGYSLDEYAGKELSFVSYQIKEYYENEPLLAWALHDKENEICVCVYKTVRSGSTLVPGIFSVKDKNIKMD